MKTIVCAQGFLPNFLEAVPKAPLRRSRASLVGSERDVSSTAQDGRPSWTAGGAPTPPLRRSRMSLTADADERWTAKPGGGATPPARPPPPVTAGYATVDKTSLVVPPPRSPARHRRKKSYDVIKSEEFGAFFTVPRSYSCSRRAPSDDRPNGNGNESSPPSRPARAYNTLGPSRPLRRRLPVREHEYGDVADDGGVRRLTAVRRSSSPDDGPAKALCSGDVIEMMKLRPLPSPPPPPRSKWKAAGETAEPHRRRNTDSAVVPFLDRRETSATSSNDDLFADVSRALLASAAENSVTTADDVSVAVRTDTLPDESDDVGSCCSAESGRPTSRTSAAADRPTSRTSTTTEYVHRPTSTISTTAAAAVENGYAMLPDVTAAGVMCAQRISVDELRVGRMTVADVRGGLLVASVSGSNLQTPESTAAVLLPPPPHNRHRPDDDDVVSVQSSMYPEVDSDEDRTSLMGVPTPPRRRSKPATRSSSTNNNVGGNAAAVDPSVTELSCQLFRLCHSNVCNLFNKVVQQVVPEDTEKRRDLQAALCFLSIVLAGLLILGFGNEKTVHHHHWDFQFPPSNQ